MKREKIAYVSTGTPLAGASLTRALKMFKYYKTLSHSIDLHMLSSEREGTVIPALGLSFNN